MCPRHPGQICVLHDVQPGKPKNVQAGEKGGKREPSDVCFSLDRFVLFYFVSKPGGGEKATDACKHFAEAAMAGQDSLPYHSAFMTTAMREVSHC